MKTPEDIERSEFKRMFEEIVGTNFSRYSYLPSYILAHWMYYILTRGVCSGGDLYVAEEIISKFKKLHCSS